jgi:hypothetical protein
MTLSHITKNNRRRDLWISALPSQSGVEVGIRISWNGVANDAKLFLKSQAGISGMSNKSVIDGGNVAQSA